jgi:hypothetical protein
MAEGNECLFEGERPHAVTRFGRGLTAVARRGSSTALAAAAVALAAGLSACGGSSGPGALPVHCTGHTLAAPDSGAIGFDGNVLAAPPAAVPGVPRPAGAVPATGVPAILDPADPRYGYSASGWDVVRVPGTGGPALWSAAIHVPGHSQPSSRDADLSPEAYTGYVIAAGGKQGQDIAAVSTGGKAGPVCALPPFDATDRTVALLPHAGVVITANPTTPSPDSKDYWLDGYSTATGQRLWSADTQTAVAENGVDFIASGDTAYVWQGRTGDIAAYNARTGQQIWVTDSGALSPLGPDNGLLGAGDGRVYALADESESSRVEALDASDGKIAWKRGVPEQTNDGSITVNRVGSGLVAVAGAGSEDYLLNAASGAVVSSLRVEPGGGQPQLCSPGGQPAVAVVGNGAISVLSTDPAGNRTIAIPPGKNVSVAVAGTVAYVRAEQANAPVYGYDLATGQRVWTVRDPRTQAESTLYAFDGGFAVLNGDAGPIFD